MSDIDIYYLVIILEGYLYSASLKSGKLSLNKSKQIHFCNEFYPSESNVIQTYHFDVIQEKYLSDYLRLIESETAKVRNSLRSQKQKVIASTAKILETARKLADEKVRAKLI